MVSPKKITPKVSINNEWLDVCRGLAILLVLFSHGRTFLLPITPSFNFFKFGGFLGVELFFVLSGFLIGGILIEKFKTTKSFTKEIPRFLLRRWLRTYPNYLLFIGINYALLIYGIRIATDPHLIEYLSFTQSLLAPHGSFFGEAWSLAIEEWFYFITPILIGLLSKLFKDKSKALFFGCVLLLSIPLLTRMLFVFTQDWSFNEFRSTTLLRIDSIIIGVILASITKSHAISNSLIRIAAWGLSLLFIFIAYLATRDDTFFDHAFYKVFFFPIADLGCAGVIALGLDFNIRKSVSMIFSFLARCSYSAYLVNIPIIVLLKQYSWPAHSNVIQWLAYFFATLFCSWFIYQGFEKKMLTLRDRLIER